MAFGTTVAKPTGAVGEEELALPEAILGLSNPLEWDVVEDEELGAPDLVLLNPRPIVNPTDATTGT